MGKPIQIVFPRVMVDDATPQDVLTAAYEAACAAAEAVLAPYATGERCPDE